LDHHHRHTLAALFSHPTSHNIQWRDVLALFERLGPVTECHRGGWRVEADGQTHTLGRARARELTMDEVIRVRHILQTLGVVAEGATAA
jgi:hypothetical protein